MRKSIIALRIALSAAFLFFGFFFLIAGVWGVLSGYGAHPAGLEYLMMLYGGSMLAAGIIVALKVVEARKRRWIVAARIASSTTFLFFGLIFLIWSFVLGSRIGIMLNPLTLLFGGFGGSMLAAGTITLLRTVR